MAVKISVTKALEDKIRKALDDPRAMEHCGTLIRQLVSVIDDAYDKRTRKAENGVPDPKDVIRTIKGVLGSRAYCPPNPGSAFYGYIKSRTKFLNVSLEDIERAAVYVRDNWKLPTSVEWIIRKLDLILDEIVKEEDLTRPDEEFEWQLVTGRS